MGEIYLTVVGHGEGKYYAEKDRFCRPFQVKSIEKIEGADEENEKLIREKIKDDRYVMAFHVSGTIKDWTILMQDSDVVTHRLKISGELNPSYDEGSDKTYYLLKIKEIEVLKQSRGLMAKIKSTLQL